MTTTGARTVRPNLRHLRIEASKTNRQIAEAMNLPLATYAEWETGERPIPHDALGKLAKLCRTTTDALLNRHPPLTASLGHPNQELAYYGELAVHFRGGGAPLLLAIIDAEVGRVEPQITAREEFIEVRSLSNQLVAIRRAAISDIHFVHDDADNYPAPLETYNGLGPRIPDPRDWQIIEALSGDGDLSVNIDDYAPKDIARMQEHVEITDEDARRAVADGARTAEQVEADRRQIGEAYFSLASNITYQLSDGRRCSELITEDNQTTHDDLRVLFGLAEDDDADTVLVRSNSGARRAFIQLSALDYFIVPAHKFDAGRDDAIAAEEKEAEPGRLQG